SVEIFRHFRTQRKFLSLALVLDSLLIVQLVLAGLVVWSVRSPVVTTFHVWTGALILGTSVLICLRCYRLLELKALHGVSPQQSRLGGTRFTASPGRTLRANILSFWELTKPEITALVLVAVFIGYYLASVDDGAGLMANGWRLFHLLLGSAFVSGGVAVLNEFLERQYDGLMLRTRMRPIPSGKVSPRQALIFGVVISVAGVVYLALTVNFLVSMLSSLTLILYLFVYTPSKRKTSWNTLIGAFPGALPPVGGWLAVKESVSLGAWILFGILFLWQIPHFFSIAWIYRKDYGLAGFKMLPSEDETGVTTGSTIVALTAALLICSLALALVGLAGSFYVAGAAILGTAFVAVGVDMAVRRTNTGAKRLLLASVLYLPALLIVLLVDRGLFR
ncbi:MAG: heme o synthase, partial [Fidelibacterota bacterium]